MRPTELLQEIRKMRFEEAYQGWCERRLTQEEAARLLGVHETIAAKGLFCSLYTDRGSHYWLTPTAGGKVDKTQRTQFGRALLKLGIEMIPAYSPEARGRSERAFGTHQERLPRELAAEGMTTLDRVNRYLAETYRPAFNDEFTVPAQEASPLRG